MRRSRGFTLVEVLAAISILAVVLPVLMAGLSLAMDAASVAKRRAQATTLAQAKLDELIVSRDFSVAAGAFTNHPEYRWSISVQPWSSPTTDGLTSSLEHLEVVVSWQQRGREYRASLSTLLYSAATEDLGGLLP